MDHSYTPPIPTFHPSWARVHSPHSRIGPIKEAAKTIRRHWSGILRWYDSKINNGILEGLNSLVQATKAKARGYGTFKNFIYMITGKLDYTKVGLPT